MASIRASRLNKLLVRLSFGISEDADRVSARLARYPSYLLGTDIFRSVIQITRTCVARTLNVVQDLFCRIRTARPCRLAGKKLKPRPVGASATGAGPWRIRAGTSARPALLRVRS